MVAPSCTRGCGLGPAGHCLSCGRTLGEIAEWSAASEPRRREIADAAAARAGAVRAAGGECYSSPAAAQASTASAGLPRRQAQGSPSHRPAGFPPRPPA
ncbi:DUF1289 domain-containing protein [Rhodovastum atsumiense]|uniref:DUF1289 domain-containing protein n=1 Tax=Rhodovastum atsumiense TaxID=504468 RepID=A0A5M6ITI7_9PROT|nr:DUF1289 domain-containing protein [Rhodovastum atsumiense]